MQYTLCCTFPTYSGNLNGSTLNICADETAQKNGSQKIDPLQIIKSDFWDPNHTVVTEAIFLMKKRKNTAISYGLVALIQAILLKCIFPW